MSRQQRIQAALSPLCVEHLQELRDFGVPQTVQQALTLSMRVGHRQARCNPARCTVGVDHRRLQRG